LLAFGKVRKVNGNNKFHFLLTTNYGPAHNYANEGSDIAHGIARIPEDTSAHSWFVWIDCAILTNEFLASETDKEHVLGVWKPAVNKIVSKFGF
jgi:hypothetical protein